MNYPPIPATAAGRLRPLRPAWRRERRRRKLSVGLWLPVSLLWLVLAPLAVVALPFLAAVLLPRRISPQRAILAAAGLLLALSGTIVEVEAPEASIRIRLI